MRRATTARRRRSSRSPGRGPARRRPHVADMVPGVEIYDPLFSWPAIPGASGYEIEINPTAGFAQGSKVMTASTTALLVRAAQDAPEQHLLLARPRPRSAGSGRSVEQRALRSTKTYDQTVLPGPANLHVYDIEGTLIALNGSGQRARRSAGSTVPGARYYEVQLNCGSGTIKTYTTANTSWTLVRATSGSSRRAGPPDAQPGLPGSSSDSSVDLEPGRAPVRRVGARVRGRRGRRLDDRSACSAQVTFTDGRPEPFSNAPIPCGNAFCAGMLTDRATIYGRGRRQDRPTRARCSAGRPADMDDQLGVVEPSEHYWVTIARDSELHDERGAGLHRRPVLRAAGRRWWTRARSTTGRSSRSDDKGGRATSFARPVGGGFAVSPTFQHASVPPTPISPVGGADGIRSRRLQVDAGAGAGAATTRSRSRRTIRSARSSSRPRRPRRRTRRRRPIRSARPTYWRVRANNDDGKGLAWSGVSTFVQTLPGARSSRRRRRSSGSDVPGAERGRRSTARRATRCRTCGPDGSVHVTCEHPEHGGQLHEDDRHRPRHGAGAGRVRERSQAAPTRRRATSCTRSRSRAARRPS